MINGKCYEGCEVMTKFGKLEAHLLTRNYRHDVHPYRQWIDESEGVVTFPLYRFDGMLAGYQTYRPVLLSSIATEDGPVFHTCARQTATMGNLSSFKRWTDMDN